MRKKNVLYKSMYINFKFMALHHIPVGAEPTKTG